MTTSATAGIPYIATQQAQPEVTHNQALNMLQGVMFGVISSGIDTPPGSPSEGDSYIVGTSPTGAWLGKENAIAIYLSSSWVFIPDRDSSGTPIPMGTSHEGMRVWLKSDSTGVVWTGTEWIVDDLRASATGGFSGNSSLTTITATSTPTAINAQWDESLSLNRFAFQDVCTFNSGLDEVQTTFSHGLSNNDVVRFVEGGTLPSELSEDTDYYVISSASTSFQVSLTLGGSAISLTGTGTPTNYYRHENGVSETGWMVYRGPAVKGALFTGWASCTKTGTTETFTLTIMRTATKDHTAGVLAITGGPSSVSTTEDRVLSLSGMGDLNDGDGALVYIQNTSNTDDVTVVSVNMSVKA